jgi:hypothetical protein
MRLWPLLWPSASARWREVPPLSKVDGPSIIYTFAADFTATIEEVALPRLF